MAPPRNFSRQVSVADEALLDGPAHALRDGFRRLEAGIMNDMGIPPELVGDSRYSTRQDGDRAPIKLFSMLGEDLTRDDEAAMGPDGKLYHADGLYHRLPEHLRPLVGEIRQWEKDLLADPRSACVYADWCDTQGWSERAGELRRT